MLPVPLMLSVEAHSVAEAVLYIPIQYLVFTAKVKPGLTGKL
jgi:hypothetical protein